MEKHLEAAEFHRSLPDAGEGRKHQITQREVGVRQNFIFLEAVTMFDDGHDASMEGGLLDLHVLGKRVNGLSKALQEVQTAYRKPGDVNLVDWLLYWTSVFIWHVKL